LYINLTFSIALFQIILLKDDFLLVNSSLRFVKEKTDRLYDSKKELRAVVTMQKTKNTISDQHQFLE